MTDTCDYMACQAGKVILPNAPRVRARWSIDHQLVVVESTTPAPDVVFHPGCWKAFNG